ncbi:MAG: sodium/glutamate symporter [Myxococcota bacterium]
MEIQLNNLQVLILAILVLWVGVVLTARVPFLQRLNVPPAVSGGVPFAVLLAVAGGTAGLQVEFQLDLRDDLLLCFFSTIGLQAKFARLREGGGLLGRMLLLTVLFLFLQNLMGVAGALGMGSPPALGLLGGSVALAGGHGTAITWGRLAESRGAEGAIEIGLAFATFGLILGGVVGGPIANALVRRFRLRTPGTGHGEDRVGGREGEKAHSITTGGAINSILLLAVCVGVGAQVNALLHVRGIILPGFLTAMGTGIVLTNLADWRGWRLDEESVDLINDLTLHLYLAMSLMSMALASVLPYIGPIALILTLQVALIVAFTWFLVFRVCGSDYDAVVVCAGFAGLGLGATPVGVANMSAVSRQYGPSTKAFLLIPLLGAFFLDIANAFVIQAFLALAR